MLDQIGPVIMVGAGGCVLGYITGYVNFAEWRDRARDLHRDLGIKKFDILAHQNTIAELRAKLFPLEVKEAKRLSQLRSIAPLGARAHHAKRKEKRAAAVAKTLAELPSIGPRATSIKTESGAGAAA